MFVQLSSFVIKTKVVQNINRMSERQAGRQTERQTDRKTDRSQTEKHIITKLTVLFVK